MGVNIGLLLGNRIISLVINKKEYYPAPTD